MTNKTPPTSTEILSDEDVAKALIRSNLASFIQQSFKTLNPGYVYQDNWHIHAIAWALEQVRLGKITRLIINMPPRSLKSISASVAFPAFVHGLNPSQEIIAVSYSQNLAIKLHNDYRVILESSWYKSLFPNTRIDRRKDSQNELLLTKRGTRLATSVGGTLTGRGGDIVIIDDPLKASDAYSDSNREAVNDWFGSTLSSRLNDKTTGAIVIVTQRVHAHDLVGHILERSPDDWTVLNLPAIAASEEIVQINENRVYRRAVGDILHAAREPKTVLDQLRRDLGGDAFEAQYQQTPVPPGGAMFKRDSFRYYDSLPTDESTWQVFQSWDTASKTRTDNDWSVCTTWIYSKGLYHLLDVCRKKMTYPQLRAEAIRLRGRYKPQMILIEDTGVGTGLIEDIRAEGIDVRGVTPEKSKEARAAIQSYKFESGRVLFPRDAPWLSGYLTELLSFPGSRHDDQVDATVQALAYQYMGIGTIHRGRV